MVERYLRCSHQKSFFENRRTAEFITIKDRLKYAVYKRDMIIQTPNRGLVKIKSIKQGKESSLVSIFNAMDLKISKFEVPNSEIVEYYPGKELYPIK